MYRHVLPIIRGHPANILEEARKREIKYDYCLSKKGIYGQTKRSQQ